MQGEGSISHDHVQGIGPGPGKERQRREVEFVVKQLRPNAFSFRTPPSLSRPYPPTSTIVNRYLASHVAISTME